jgi:hypothetical protein
MADWHDTAKRALSILDGDTSDAGVRTVNIVNHVLDENNCDDYISKDFFNVQQTAGGLPDTVTMDRAATTAAFTNVTAITWWIADRVGVTLRGPRKNRAGAVREWHRREVLRLQWNRGDARRSVHDLSAFPAECARFRRQQNLMGRKCIDDRLDRRP